MDTIGNFSINIVEIILTNVAEVSFRKTAENIKTMCNQKITSQGVWNVVQTVGEKINLFYLTQIYILVYVEVKGIREDLIAVELITSKNWNDIAKLKSVK